MLLFQTNLQNTFPALPGSGNLLGLLLTLNLDEGVPDIVGLTEPAAIVALEVAGFIPGAITLGTSAIYPAGIVISQSPAAFVPSSPGSAVNFVIASGLPPQNIMPDIVGLLFYEGLQLLIQAGVYAPGQIGYFGTDPITVKLRRSTQPAGTILSTIPIAGITTTVNQPVTLIVAEFPFGAILHAGP